MGEVFSYHISATTSDKFYYASPPRTSDLLKDFKQSSQANGVGNKRTEDKREHLRYVLQTMNVGFYCEDAPVNYFAPCLFWQRSFFLGLVTWIPNFYFG